MRRALFVLGGLTVLGIVVAASGIVPLKASSGHWGITRWFLEFSMRRSVETHTIGSRVPDLADSALILRGAGHYESGCKPCHGAPGEPRNRVPLGMTPTPPWLTEAAPQWDPDELFYIVRHGVKFTGMPAWPAPDRTDEVWAMVAFLRLLPDLDAAEYRRMARGETSPPDGVPGAVRESCARCHGLDGLGRGAGAFPKLAGQSAVYMEATLEAYADGRRASGIMQPPAGELTPEARGEVAHHYARQAPARGLGGPGPEARPVAAPPPGEGEANRGPPSDDGDEPALSPGEAIARRGIPARRVPSCVDCHGPGPDLRNPYYPRLAGQHPGYLAQQLRLFAQGRRGGSPYAQIMRLVASRLTEEQMTQVAAWYGSLEP